MKTKSKEPTLYRRLLSFTVRHRWRVFASMFASLFVAGADVASAKLIQPFVDYILAEKRAELVYLVPVIVIGVFFVKGVARFFQEYWIKTAGQLVVQDIRNLLYRHSLRLSVGFYTRTQSGTVLSRILNDVGMVQNAVATVLVDALRESFTLVGLTALVFYNDWRLACIAFLILPVSVIPAAVIGRRIKESARQGQGRIGGLVSHLQQAFSGIKVVKAFGTEAQEADKFKRENRAYYGHVKRVMRYDSATTPIMEILASFGISAVFWYGIQRVLSGAMTQGELFSFSAAMLMMYGPLRRLTKVSNQIQRSLAGAVRFFELFDEVPEISDAADAYGVERLNGFVKLDDVSFSYGDEPVLHHISLEAKPGDVVALVGPSGAGKSTLAALLMRFYDPTDGAILIDGHDLRRLSLESFNHNLAMVDQETFLFNDSIRNNIRYGRLNATDAEVESAAKQAFADEFIRELPEGYDTGIGDRGVRLSGGQRQRICIARAILRDAPILILDEATSALDTESEMMVQGALANLMTDRTTFVIAHRLSTIMHADKIVVLDAGRVREVGTHSELLAQGGLYRKLYDIQFRDE